MIKIWHLLVVLLVSPYVFAFFTPDGVAIYNLINFMLCFLICGTCICLMVIPDLLDQLNKRLDK